MAERRTRRTRSEIITDKIAKLQSDKEKYESKMSDNLIWKDDIPRRQNRQPVMKIHH